jgi:hypothetical protein
MTLPLVEIRRDIAALHQLVERPELVPAAHRELMLVYEHVRCSVLIGALPTTRGSAGFAGVALCFYNPTNDRAELLEVEKERLGAGVVAICMILAREVSYNKSPEEQLALLERWVTTVATTEIAVTTRILVSTIGEPRPLPVPVAAPPPPIIAVIPALPPPPVVADEEEVVVLLPQPTSAPLERKRKRDDADVPSASVSVTNRRSSSVAVARKPSDDDNDESDECGICLVNKPNCRLLPCAHKSVCDECIARLFNSGSERGGQCPRCTLPVQHVLYDDDRLKEASEFIASTAHTRSPDEISRIFNTGRRIVPSLAEQQQNPSCNCSTCERTRRMMAESSVFGSTSSQRFQHPSRPHPLPGCYCAVCCLQRSEDRQSALRGDH